MKTDPQKIVFKLIFGIAIVLFALNTYMEAGITITGGRIRSITSVFFILTIIISIVYFVKRTSKTYQVFVITCSVFLLLNISLVFEIAAFKYQYYQLSQIAKINTCEKAKLTYQEDLESGDLRYFMFGMGVEERTKDQLTNVYNLDVYHMGCIVDNSLACYNKLVEQHINTELELDFWAFLEERR